MNFLVVLWWYRGEYLCFSGSLYFEMFDRGILFIRTLVQKDRLFCKHWKFCFKYKKRHLFKVKELIKLCMGV